MEIENQGEHVITILETAGPFLTRAEFAELLRVTPATLIEWQKRAHGPTPIVASEKKTLYRSDDVRAFLAASDASATKIEADKAEAVATALAADRERVTAIYQAAPTGSEPLRDHAVRSGATVEAFAALLICGAA